MISATKPDWQREMPRQFWDPSRRLLKTLRSYQKARFARRRFVFSYRFWSAVSGAEIPLSTRIEGGMIMPHPNGIVIHPDVKIGPNCTIFQQVTLGTNLGTKGVPEIGGHVDIGPGAKILGPVKIGSHVVIGANSVVLRDVPENSVAVGVPARVL